MSSAFCTKIQIPFGYDLTYAFSFVTSSTINKDIIAYRFVWIKHDSFDWHYHDAK